ncbi:hypothetical protein Gotur_023739 [Gossypium turneri]
MEVSGIEEEEATAEVDTWNYVFGYAKIAVVKCAIELGIADVIENYGSRHVHVILHDWDDEECIKILKKCREAIPEDKGKVIIVEAVLEEHKEDDKLGFVGLMLDMAMMAHTDIGKERTLKEWSYVLRQSGFTRFTVNPIRAVQSVIQAYP